MRRSRSCSETHLEERLLFKRDVEETLNQAGKVSVRGLHFVTADLPKECK